MKGKVTRKHRVNSERDFYPTPKVLTRELLRNSIIWGTVRSILEPACGEGAITDVLREDAIEFDYKFHTIVSYDKYVGRVRKDFMDEVGKFDLVITNPPFNQWDEFFEKACTVAKQQIIFLAPVDYAYTFQRYKYFGGWYEGFFLKDMLMFNRKIMFEKELMPDMQFHTGAQICAWFSWVKWDASDYQGIYEQTFAVADIQQYLKNRRKPKNVLTEKTSGSV